MASWFPDVSDAEGVREATKGGVFGALAFAAMIALGMIILLATNRTPVMDQATSPIGALIGMAVEFAFVLFVAWRFRHGQGAFVGAALLLLFIVEIVGKVMAGTTNVGWMIAYVAIFVALLNGVRGAWANRSFSSQPEMSDS